MTPSPQHHIPQNDTDGTFRGSSRRASLRNLPSPDTLRSDTVGTIPQNTPADEGRPQRSTSSGDATQRDSSPLNLIKKRPTRRHRRPVKTHSATRRWALYFLKATVLLGAFFGLIQLAPSMPAVGIALLWTVLSALSAVGFVYHATVRKTLKQYEYMDGGKLSWINNGRFFTILVGFVLAAVCMAGLLFEAPKWETSEWTIVAIAVPAYCLAYLVAEKALRREYRPLFRESGALRWSQGLVTLWLLLAFVVILLNTPLTNYDTLEAAFNEAPQPYQDSPTALMAEANQLTSLTDGITAYAISETAHSSLALYYLVRVIFVASAFFSIANLLSVCALKPREMLRTISTLHTEETMGQRVSLHRVSTVLAALLPLILFVGFLYANNQVVRYEQTNERTLVDEFIAENKEIAIYIVDGQYVRDQFILETMAVSEAIEDGLRQNLLGEQ